MGGGGGTSRKAGAKTVCQPATDRGVCCRLTWRFPTTNWAGFEKLNCELPAAFRII